MDKGTYLGLISVVVMAAFIVACVWALLPAQKRRFDEAARLALDEEQASEATSSKEESR